MVTIQKAFSGTQYLGTKLEYYEVNNSVNITNNTSIVRVDIYVITLSGGYGGTSYTSPFYVTVDGQQKSISVPGWELARNETKKLGSLDFIVKHNSDGKKNASISSSYTLEGLGTSAISTTLRLSDIPRSSILGNIPNFTYDSNENVGVLFNVPITKYSNTFYNVLDIYVQNENITWTKVGTRNNFNGGNITFNLEELQTAYSAMSKAQTTYFKFVLATYSNSNKTTKIGEDTKDKVYGSISMTGIEPSFDITTVEYEDTNDKTYAITNDRSIFIKGHSNLKITLNQKAIANKGATLGLDCYAMQVTTVDGLKTQAVSQSEVFPISKSFERISENKINVFVIDSRSITTPKFGEYQQVTMWNYEDPKFDISACKAYRLNGVDSSSFIDIKGSYYVFPEKPNVNTITKAVLKYREKDSSSDYTQINVTSNITCENGIFSLNNYNIGNFDIEKEYEFAIEVEDKLSTTIMIANKDNQLLLNSAKPYIWHMKNKKVMGIGGKPNNNLKSGSIQTFGGLYLASGNEVLDYDVVTENTEQKNIKLKDNNYLDSSSITHNQELLQKYLKTHFVQLEYNTTASYVKGTETLIKYTTNKINGTCLTQTSNSRIIVNDDKVKGVFVSAHLDYQVRQATRTSMQLRIKKNETIIARGRTWNDATQYASSEVSIPSFYIPVQKGDYIESFYDVGGSDGTLGINNSFTGVWMKCIAVLK